MTDKVFKEEISETLEVYMDDMIVKYDVEELHDKHLSHVFQRVQQYNIRLKLEKCAFEARANKFLDFYLMNISI